MTLGLRLELEAKMQTARSERNWSRLAAIACTLSDLFFAPIELEAGQQEANKRLAESLRAAVDSISHYAGASRRPNLTGLLQRHVL